MLIDEGEGAQSTYGTMERKKEKGGWGRVNFQTTDRRSWGYMCEDHA